MCVRAQNDPIGFLTTQQVAIVQSRAAGAPARNTFVLQSDEAREYGRFTDLHQKIDRLPRKSRAARLPHWKCKEQRREQD